jgi:transcriptional regulator with XRE-family HTH domain
MTQETKRHGSGRHQVRPDAGREIRLSRVSQGLSQAELGVMMGYSISTGQVVVSNLESGRSANVEQAINAAGALGLSLDAVIVWVMVEKAD